MLRQLLETPESFFRVLLENRGSTVGHAKNPFDCPIARFINLNLPKGRFHSCGVNSRSSTLYGPTFVLEEIYPHPNWVREFIKAVDKLDGEITTDVAIEIMYSIINTGIAKDMKQEEINHLTELSKEPLLSEQLQETLAL